MTEHTAKLEKLIEAAEDAGLETYGDYNGRNFFKGYAIKLDALPELLALGAALERAGLGDLAEGSAHVDSLGRGYIVAFSDRQLRT